MTTEALGDAGLVLFFAPGGKNQVSSGKSKQLRQKVVKMQEEALIFYSCVHLLINRSDQHE